MAAWESFYVIVGSAAAALTGLMFVALAILADYHGDLTPSQGSIDAFSTPTVVHFGAVLFQSAILSAPWPTLTGVRISLGIAASAGLIYTCIVMARARRQTEYKPVFEDWLFHTVLPLAAYASIAGAAVALPLNETLFLFVIGGTALLLLSVGIHNAWDVVIFLVLSEWEKRTRDREAGDDKRSL